MDTNQDRLSQLPDGVVAYILSFLSTKEAVATSILSTRYKSIYASVPTIDIDFNEFLILRDDEYYWPEQDFVGIVNRMIELRTRGGLSLSKFRIEFATSSSILPILTWTQQALELKIEILDITVHMPEKLDDMPHMTDANIVFMPTQIFSCRTLVILKLSTHIKVPIKVPEHVDLPNLKVLHLMGCVSVGDKNFLVGKTFADCYLLEELKIFFCTFFGVDTLDISIASLKRLGVYYCSEIKKIIVDTPNLLYLEVTECPDTPIIMKNLESLVEAYVHMEMSPETNVPEVQSLAKSISGMSNAKSLTLWHECVWALSIAGYTWPPFQRLTYLELHTDPPRSYELLPTILDSVPNLESLVLRIWTLEDYVGDPDYEVLQVPVLQNEPVHLSRHLKEVEIWQLYGCENDVRLVQYIMQYGEVLKRITICQNEHNYFYSPESLRKKLMMLTRSSRSCQLCFI